MTLTKYKYYIKNKRTTHKFFNKVSILIHRLLVTYGFLDYQNIIKKPFQTVYVSPDLIKYGVNEREVKSDINYNSLFGTIQMVGRIHEKDIHPKNKRLDDSIDIIAFKERFLNHKHWEETEYRKIKNKLDAGEESRWCNNWEEYKKTHLLRWESLYANIKEKGYKKQSLLKNLLGDYEIQVVVTKHGELLFFDGRHRLAIARILGLKKIPVMVTVWHADFIEYVLKMEGKRVVTPKTAIKYVKGYQEELDE